MISLIWAMDSNWLIGIDDKLPWRYKEDLIYFKNMVKNKPVLMGDVTYDSLKGYYKDKPFPFGKIYVGSLNKHLKIENATIINDIEKFLSTHKEELFVIGGSTIYKLALPYADRLYITHILNRHPGNVYFPKFDLNNYKVINKKLSEKLIFTCYEKRTD